jgi:S1-C subfamily serine protease
MCGLRRAKVIESENVMLERTLSCILAVVAVGLGSHSSAQQAPTRDEAAAAHQRELAAVQREIAARERELARERSAAQAITAADTAELRRELARAREQLSVSAGEIARLSAQMTQPVLRDVMSNVRYLAGGQAVLGLSIDDTELGVLVSGVTPNGPAAEAGVTVGDTIVAINDIELGSASVQSPSTALYGEVGNVVPGDEVKLRVLRGGDYRDLVVEAGENQPWRSFAFDGGRVSWPGEGVSFRQFLQPRAWSDMELVTLTPALGEYFGVEEGLLVVRAGRAAELGFRDGDVILDLGGREPQSPEHALRIMASFEPGESLQAAIMRQRRREALSIRVPAAAQPQW